MTVIRPNSISGINSITAQVSALNFYDSAGDALSIGASVTGNVTGDVTGNLIGNVTGNLTGDINAGIITATTITGVSTIGVTTVTATNLTVNGNAYPTAGPLSNRNLVVNGAMQVWQRGDTTTSVTGNSYYSADRFRNVTISAGTWTLSKSTTVPIGQGFAASLKYDCTTANASLSAGSLLMLEQRFEGQDMQSLKKGTASAESLTLSFWVRSNKTGTYIAELRDEDNGRTISQSYAIDASDTWEKKTLTFAGDTTGALDNDNALSFYASFYLAAGTDYSSGTLATSWETRTNANRAVGQVNLADNTANEWYITGVQLEVGEVATPFEHRSYGDELARCQRYYQLVEGGGGGVASSSTGIFLNLIYSEMRSAPSIGQSAPLTINDASNNFSQSSASINSSVAGTRGAFLQLPNFTGLTHYRPFILRNPDTQRFTLSSEL